MKRKNLISILIIWSSVIVFSLVWNIFLIQKNNKEVVLNKSRSFFEQLLVARAWNADHSGVYVPVTEKDQPNEFLVDSLRDLITVNGIKLTKINPAYMTRQIAEINLEENDLRFHITSLNPIRPANNSDSWEKKSLESFETGVSETLELCKVNDIREYRYMAPLITSQSCLKCHAVQGYKLGDIRGGISIRFPAGLYLSIVKKSIFSMVFIHFLILVFGIAGILFLYYRLNYFYSVLENKNRELHESNETKDKLFSIIAHDLKSPFSNVLGISELLHENYYSLNKNDLDNLTQALYKSAQKTSDLLLNLLDWASTQLGKFEFNPEQQNLYSTCENVIELLKPVLEEKGINVLCEIPRETTVSADKNMLKLIVRNLLSNAVKFSFPKGVVQISAKEDTENVTISISDSGVGISQERLKQLFDFTKIDSTPGTSNEKGTGLGLMLCKEFVEKHGGKIFAESEPGKGTKIAFTIPQ